MIYNQIYPGGYVREFKYLSTDGDLKEKQSPSVYRRKNMEIFTIETIGNYTSDPYAKNDHKYSKEMQEIRKELRKLDQETKKDGGVVDWNRMLNDFM